MISRVISGEKDISILGMILMEWNGRKLKMEFENGDGDE